MRELFWPLEFRIYIFRPMRMTDAALTILALSLLPCLLATGKSSQHERAHSLFFTDSSSLSLPHILGRTDHLFPLSPQSSPLSIMRTIGVWEIILSSFIFPSKPTDPQRNKLDIFNSCFDFSILIPVLMTASHLLLWPQHFNSCPDNSISTPALTLVPLFLLNSTTVYLFLWLTAQGFLLSQAVIKTSKLKTINIFVNSFVLPLNITRGNRTQQPQLPFLYKW